MKIIFFGSDPGMSAPVLEALVKAGHEVMLVVTKGETLNKFKMQNSKCKIVQANTVEDISKEKLQREIATAAEGGLAMTEGEARPDAIVLAAFGPPFLGEDLLDWPKYGCLNVHVSLLPRWRGAAPVFAAIKNGDKKTGVTIMKMTAKVDRGPILGQREINILVDDNRESLTKKLGLIGGKLIVETLKKLEKGEIKFIFQPKKSPTVYTHRLTKEDGRIDWNKSPVETERFIRAVTPWPGAETNIKYKISNIKYKTAELKILKAHLEGDKLIIDEVQLSGKNPISWRQFLAGHSNAKLI